MTEQEHIHRLIQKDEAAFRLLVHNYQGLIRNCCYLFTHDAYAAEDLTQEVFIAVFQSIAQFKGNAKLTTWMYRIAVTKSLNYNKKQSRKKRYSLIYRLFGKERIEDSISAPAMELPQFQLETEERRKVLHTALQQISTNQRIAFTLAKIEGCSYEEIATIMELSISSVEAHIHRAKQNLRKKLLKYYNSTLS